jgi:hypothetical protein
MSHCSPGTVEIVGDSVPVERSAPPGFLVALSLFIYSGGSDLLGATTQPVQALVALAKGTRDLMVRHSYGSLQLR